MQRYVGLGQQADQRRALRDETVVEHPEHLGAGSGGGLPEPLFEHCEVVEFGGLAVEQVEQAVGTERRWIHVGLRVGLRVGIGGQLGPGDIVHRRST